MTTSITSQGCSLNLGATVSRPPQGILPSCHGLTSNTSVSAWKASCTSLDYGGGRSAGCCWYNAKMRDKNVKSWCKMVSKMCNAKIRRILWSLVATMTTSPALIIVTTTSTGAVAVGTLMLSAQTGHATFNSRPISCLHNDCTAQRRRWHRRHDTTFHIFISQFTTVLAMRGMRYKLRNSCGYVIWSVVQSPPFRIPKCRILPIANFRLAMSGFFWPVLRPDCLHRGRTKACITGHVRRSSTSPTSMR